MTQRRWNTTDGWDVLTGWDRPLQHFFVTIDRKCRNCNGEGGFGDEANDADICTVCDGQGAEYLFNNLDDTTYVDEMGAMTIEQVATVLALKLTAYPDGLIADLQMDKRNNVGNYIRNYDPIGEEKK